MFAKLMAQHPELGGESILLTIAFTPGSLSLSAYCLTPKGFEFCRQADPNAPNGYNPAIMSDRAQLLLSDRILGSVFAPQGDIWNYSVGLGASFSASMPYTMQLSNGMLDFWAPLHRPNHFSQFQAAAIEEPEGDGDLFA